MPMPKGFNPEEEENRKVEEIIPEGLQLFTLYNLYFGKFDDNPRGKQRSDDYVWWLNIQFTHHETGLLLSRMDNGNFTPDDFHNRRWANNLKLERVGRLNTHPMFNEFMVGLNAPTIKPDPKYPKMISYWVIEGGKAQFRGHDEEPPGPLGLPVMLNVIHKEVPKFEAERNSHGESVKETVRGYERTKMIMCRDDKGKIEKITLPFIECTEIPDLQADLFGANDLRWPKVYPFVDDSQKEIRGQYHKYGERYEDIADRTRKQDEQDAGVDWS